MLTLEARPQTFRDMAGQDLVKKSLMHICKDPTYAPHTILLEGSFGSGKTTAARIFAKALNCPNRTPQGDACGDPNCSICGQDIQGSMYYAEYDSALVGNVESIKQLRSSFYFGYTKGYKVIVLDETQLVSKQAQGALLKVFEEPDPNIFFVLCTTDPDKLLAPIVSRSLELRYSTLPKDEIFKYLIKILDKSKLTIPEDEINSNLLAICDRSHGHMRNAIMLLDSMYLLQEDFKDSVKSSREPYIKLFTTALYYKDYARSYPAEQIDNRLNETLLELSRFPVSDLKQDYEHLVLNIIENTFKQTSDDKQMELLTKDFKNTLTLVNIFNDPVIYKMFTDDILFMSAMHILINKLKALKKG